MTTTITPANTLETLKKYILVDGFPIVFDLDKSKGAHFFNAYDGKTYLDCFSFFASLPIGFNHPGLSDSNYQKKLLKAAQVRVANPDIYTVEYAEFVDTFANIAGRPQFKHYFFIDGGALAVENALKVAFDWKIRKNMAAGRGEKGQKVIYFKDAFHGRTGYTLTTTNTFDPNKTKYFPKFDWIRVENPYVDETFSPEDMDRREKASLASIEDALKKHKDDVAAILLEPIQSEGGDRHFRNSFFRGLRKICDENDVLLIFDEVQSGMGITGKMWTYEHTDVVPDIVAFAKKAQLGGIMSTTRVDDIPDNVFKVPSRINSTWGGNLVDMVRSTRYMQIIQKENLVDNARDVGAYFQKRLQDLRKDFSSVTNVRGRGLLIAFDLPSTQHRNRFIEENWKNGGLILKSGERSVRVRPVLDFSRENVDEAITLFSKGLKAVS